MLAPLVFYLFIYPITRLPFRVIYLLSDGLFFLIYYLLPYRKGVVLQNLRNSFPEKSEREVKEISKKFYRHFCDLILESFKMFAVSKEEVAERFSFPPSEIQEKFFREQKSIIMAGGHYNNWEAFAVACAIALPFRCVGLYKPLQNKWFDKKIRTSRVRFGLNLWSIKSSSDMFKENQGELTAFMFLMDQSPSNPTRCHWMTFLNQDTGVSYGVEKFAREYNQPVIFGRILKRKRGHYYFESELITDDPGSMPPGKIVEELTKRLEKDIIKEPEYWLWSHNRWKHKKPA